MERRLIAGDTLSFPTSVEGFSAADGWLLKFALVPLSGAGTRIDLTSTADGAGFLTQVAADVTAAWALGRYSWQSYVVKGAESYTVATGTTEVVANPRTSSGPLDLRSDARIALEAVQAVIAGRATDGVLSYRINERELRSYEMRDLLTLESKLKADVRREDAAARLAAGLPSRKQLHVRLHRA